jgi:hypothetical protein
MDVLAMVTMGESPANHVALWGPCIVGTPFLVMMQWLASGGAGSGAPTGSANSTGPSGARVLGVITALFFPGIVKIRMVWSKFKLK